MATSAHRATTRNRWQLLATLVVCGLAAGLLLDLLTAWVSSSGPSSADGQYTLRGNGALIVPLGGGLVLVTAAWTALVMRWLGHPQALAIGVGAGVIELAVALLVGLVVDIYAPAAWRGPLGPVMVALWVLAFALPVAAPTAAAVWLRPKGAAQIEPAWTAVAMILSPVSLFAGAALGVPLSQLAG
jgi:hypothetical protein